MYSMVDSLHCTIPKHYPWERKIILDPTPEEDPDTEENAPKTNQSNVSTSDEEGEDLERISTPEHETPNEEHLRKQRNAEREVKKARLMGEGKQKREKYENSRPG
ncbi:hypothetical protein BD779DRAFT_1479945 [Infundibulicybe gibba]|nr:hypothetical protein BD779DRAFT_1479945 [Infundibulicybe gibba]